MTHDNMKINALEIINKLHEDRILDIYSRGYTLQDVARVFTPIDINQGGCSNINVVDCVSLLNWAYCLDSFASGQFNLLFLMFPEVPTTKILKDKYLQPQFSSRVVGCTSGNFQAIYLNIIDLLEFEYVNELTDLLNEISRNQTRQSRGLFLSSLVIGAAIGAVVVYLGYVARKESKS